MVVSDYEHEYDGKENIHYDSRRGPCSSKTLKFVD